MDRASRYTTLLPYLAPAHAGFWLSFLRTGGRGRPEDQPRSPFQVVSDSGPFTRIVAAQVMSGDSTQANPVPVNRVFLLASKDACPARAGSIVPLTNPLVEESWQRLFRQRKGSVATLAGQEDGGGGLLPFASLFFCRTVQSFFHPPCPACGRDLALCRDDAVLGENGLAPYSSSLKRYLYCPACLSEQGAVDFYAFAPAGDEPAGVKGWHALVKDFGRLSGTGSLEGAFPCPACPARTECYGDAGLAVKRIVPFSFYPFYLLVFEPATLNAFDYLALLSGAGIPDLEEHLVQAGEPGRLHALRELAPALSQGGDLFFTRGEGRFLEILCLKCAFLSQLAQTVLPGAGACRFPDLAGSSDRLWVSLPRQGRGLPFFWSFSLEMIEMEDTSPVPMPPSYGSYMLGLLWFQVLAANSRQDASLIGSALAGRIDALTSSPQGRPSGFPPIDGEHTFDPANIFWSPESREVRGEWAALWRKALDLGWSLLAHGMKPDAAFTAHSFMEDLDHLLGEVKQELFGRASCAPESARRAPDEEISLILEDIVASYEAQDDSAGTLHQAGGDGARDVRFPGQAPPVQQAPGAGEQSASHRESESGQDGEETVVLSPGPAFSAADEPPAGEDAGGPGVSPPVAGMETAVPDHREADDAGPGQGTTPERAEPSTAGSPFIGSPSVGSPADGGADGTAVDQSGPDTAPGNRESDPDPEDSHETVILSADLARTLMGDRTAGKGHEAAAAEGGLPDAKVERSDAGKEQPEDPEETVIVDAGSIAPRKGGEAETAGAAAGADRDDDMEETVIMDSGSTALRTDDGREPAGRTSAGAGREDDVAQTVIMKPGTLSVGDSPETVIVEPGHRSRNDSPESVIMKPGSLAENDSPETVVVESGHRSRNDAPETVIVESGHRPRERSPEGVHPHPGRTPAQDVPETVIMGPGRAAGGSDPKSVQAEDARPRAGGPDDYPETETMEPRHMPGNDIPETGTAELRYMPGDDVPETGAAEPRHTSGNDIPETIMAAHPRHTPGNDFPETAIMGSSPAGDAGGSGGGAGTPSREEESEHPGDDGSLEETLVITPEKGKG